MKGRLLEIVLPWCRMLTQLLLHILLLLAAAAYILVGVLIDTVVYVVTGKRPALSVLCALDFYLTML